MHHIFFTSVYILTILIIFFQFQGTQIILSFEPFSRICDVNWQIDRGRHASRGMSQFNNIYPLNNQQFIS